MSRVVTSEEMGRKILNTIPIVLVRDRPDHTQALMDKWVEESGSIMPTSPLASFYKIDYQYRPSFNEEMSNHSVRYSMTVKWAPHVKPLIKTLEPWQLSFRSRQVALAASPLRRHEMRRRINRAISLAEDIKRAMLSERESHESAMIIIDRTLSQMRLDPEYIRKYILKHAESSVGGIGAKWLDALKVPLSVWKKALELLRANLEAMREHPDWFVMNMPKSGMRARSEEFTAEELLGLLHTADTLQQYQAVTVDRTRIILFGNYMSLYTLFLPDKTKWYSSILNDIIALLKPAGEYYFPMVEGGAIYARFSDLHKDGVEYHAMDGVTWDAVAAMVGGRYWHCFGVPTSGIVQIPSGESFTSLLDTIASIVASRHWKAIKIVLGDDVGVFGHGIFKSKLIEESPEDSLRKFNLGLTYALDPVVPRLAGLRASADRAGKMIHIDLMPWVWQRQVVSGKHSLAERLTHGIMYRGYISGRTILQAMQHAQFEKDYLAPSEHFLDMASSAAARGDAEREAIEFATQLGLTKVIVR